MRCPSCDTELTEHEPGNHLCSSCGAMVILGSRPQPVDGLHQRRPHRHRSSWLKRLIRNPAVAILAFVVLGGGLAVGVYVISQRSKSAEERRDIRNPAEGSRPKAPLPVLKVESEFLGKIGKASYPRAEPPDVPPELRWDFSAKRTVEYDYEQTIESVMFSTKHSQVATGKLLVKGKGDQTADFVFQGLKSQVKLDLDKAGPQAIASELPVMVVQGVKEDGSLTAADTEMDMLAKLLFPIPPRPLAVGESVDLPAMVPFNAGGTHLYAKGSIRLTLAGYAIIDGHRCAVLRSVIDISSLEVPKEIKDTYRLANTGKGILYFDVEDRCVALAEMAMLMSMRSEMAVPDMSIDGEKVPAGMAGTHEMSMDNDNLIRITRSARSFVRDDIK